MKKLFSFFENITDPFVAVRDSSKIDTVFDFLKIHSNGYKKFIFIVAILSAATALIEIHIFKFVGILVDVLSATTPSEFTNRSEDYLIQMGVALLVGLLIADSLHTLICNQTLEGNFRLKIISSIHNTLLKQGIVFFRGQPAGKISNTVTQTADALRVLVVKLASTFTFAIVFSGSMIALLAAIDPFLLIPVFAWFFGYLLVISYFVPKLKNLSGQQAGSKSDMIGQLVDTYSNISVLKIFSKNHLEMQYAKKYFSRYLHSVNQQMRFMSGVFIALTFLNAILIFGTIIDSLLLWKGGLISVGAIAAATSVALRIYTMSHWIMWETAAVFNNLGVIQDGVKILAVALPSEEASTNTLPLDSPKGISFKDVSFSYDGVINTIDSFSLNIEAGEKIALIGRSGSGKSTLAKLMLRIHNPDKGAVSIDGIDTKTMEYGHLLEHFSVVTQEVELLNRTVRENLIFEQNAIPDERMVAATKIAEAHEFILGLTDEKGDRGYDANIGVGGIRLSGGQKQRIAIARALIKNTSIVIFDEATSALDPETEAKIMINLRQSLQYKTVIVITHKLNGLKKMSRLALIDKGALIEFGSHEELITRSGLYSQMLRITQEGIEGENDYPIESLSLDKRNQIAVSIS